MYHSPSTPGSGGTGSLQERAAELRASMQSSGASGPAQGTEAATGDVYHVVEEGETLDSIAQKYGQTPDAIWNCRLNRQVRERLGGPEGLAVGETLFIPGPDYEPEDETEPVGEGQYRVKKGDCISSIAFDHGFYPETLWDHAANTELKEVRKNPNVLLPGDRVTIPELRPKEEPGETEMRHRFRRRGSPEILQIKFEDEDKKPYASLAYVIKIDEEEREGSTDAGGTLREQIPPNARSAKVTFAELDEEYFFTLGALQPVETIVGVQQRLLNLGYYRGQADGDPSPALQDAIQRFQKDNGLPKQDGDLDDATREALLTTSGS